ncbi:hypothetical protein [Mycobacterium genavense]|uniref:hypothetical protein n=1 Tax=Mycobacterium genavense TaxID=36812 RepID=UPI000471BED8|nr:hypothetical protein [Mycobacterium genavense]
MHESTGEIPDDVPIADAVEQQRATGPAAPDDDAPDWLDDADVPLEATDSDWQEQQQSVVTDPEFDEPE